MPSRLRSLAVAVAVCAVAGFAVFPAGAIEPSTPGEQSLVNFAHVWNFPFPGTPEHGQGTDIEFFTSVVPKRDDQGQKILDPDGNPILAAHDFAVVGAYSRGAYVFDITDPERPRLARQVYCRQTLQNNPELKWFGSRMILALTADEVTLCSGAGPQFGTGSGGVRLFDITDPWEYAPVYGFKVNNGAHTFTWHPTKPYGWVSTGDIPGNHRNHLPIIDFGDLLTPDPTDGPKVVADIPSVGSPHDLSFSADGSRAYVAEQHNFRIYDTTDPANPKMVSAVGVSPGTYAHTSETTPDGKILVGTEESLALGGFFAEGSGVCPGEGLVFYSIDGPLETAPVPVGHFLADIVGRTPDQRACTAHQGKIAPNNHVIVLGWYVGGVRVVDFSNPSSPREIGRAQMADGEPWAAKFYKGPYVYTGDQTRGFDVFRWTGPLDAYGKAPWEAL